MEILDVYNVHGEKIGKTIERGTKLPEGEYIKVVSIYIKNGIRYLIQKTSEQKGHIIAMTGGAVSKDNDSFTQAIIECKEELGIDLKKECLKQVGTFYREDAMFDVFLYEDEDTDLEEYPFILQESEVESIMWLTKNEIEDLILKEELRESSCQSYLQFIKDRD